MANRFLSNIKINDAYTFPASDGTNGQVIKTDGSGNLSFAQLAADSASVMYKDTFTGNGSATAFTLANALNDEVQSNVYIDGVYQSKSTYSVSGTTLTFSTAPASGHEIEVISTTGINSGPTAIFTDTFTANGSATAFTLGQTVHNENQTIVFLNGVYQFKGTYTLSGTTLTLDTAPANGVAIEVMSIGSAYSGGDILYDHDFTSAGLMTTNGSGVYSITANNSANWNTAYGWGDHSTQSYATQSYVGTQIANLVDSSPSTLDTLNELAAALGDDPNFATTTANSIGLKAPLASPSFTGIITANSSSSGDYVRLYGSSGTGKWDIYGNGANLRISDNESAGILVVDTGATFGGNVGIGATPHATASLNITNTAQHIRLNNGSELGIITLDTDGKLDLWAHGTGETINFRTGTGSGAVTMSVVGSNVGIGTTSPAQKLHINNSAALTATYQKFTNGTATAGTTLGIDADGDFLINNEEAKEIKLYTNDTQRLTIQSGGNVGIGTFTPNKKLTVYGGNDNGIWVDSSGSRYTSVAWGNNGSEKANIAYDNTNSNFALTAYGVSNTIFTNNSSERMRITSILICQKAMVMKFSI